MRHDRLLREEVVQRDFGADDSAVGIPFHPVAGYKRRHDAFSGPCRFAEEFNSPRELDALILGHGVFLRCEFHFADIYDAIVAIDQHVDLGVFNVSCVGLASPGIGVCEDSGNSKGFFDLRNVPEAQSFKGKPSPCVERRFVIGYLPEKLFVLSLVLDELEMKKDEIVNQLIDGGFLPVPYDGVDSDKTAFLQFAENGRCRSAACAGLLFYLGKRHAVPSSRKAFDDLDMGLAIPEERGEKSPEFVGELCVFCEEQPVEVLRRAEVWRHEAPVVGNSAQRHVTFGNLAAVERKSLPAGILLAFFQREWRHWNWAGDAVVKPTAIVEYFVYHPRRGGSTDDEKDVFAKRGPTVPEVFKCRKKSRLGCVHPRYFVKEHDLLWCSGRLEHFLKLKKGLAPVCKMRATEIPVEGDRLSEIIKLLAQVGVFGSRMLECILSANNFIDQKRLPNSATSVDCNKFRLLRSNGGGEFICLFNSANHSQYPPMSAYCIKEYGFGQVYAENALYLSKCDLSVEIWGDIRHFLADNRTMPPFPVPMFMRFRVPRSGLSWLRVSAFARRQSSEVHQTAGAGKNLRGSARRSDGEWCAK